MTFSDKDREVIRKHVRSSRTEQRTTGSSTTTTRVRVGERLPESVEIRSFPETVYRESPGLREYRYIERDNRTYVIEPRERTIIEERLAIKERRPPGRLSAWHCWVGGG